MNQHDQHDQHRGMEPMGMTTTRNRVGIIRGHGPAWWSSGSPCHDGC
ncbi:MAG: hypothetical protein RI601_11620 [Desulfurivibrionaceae bacterium]|nr:hypothetical protein [Desulfurivibrionaceae bacterium]